VSDLTLVHMQEQVLSDAVWELAVPNGNHTVRVAAGDPDRVNSVRVTDGRLTISNAPGASNNKILPFKSSATPLVIGCWINSRTPAK
jgi:hypothetical protein